MKHLRTSRAHYRAFTLIELLIVVAIIAILAAIAVPNFLEAQTRAKTSRVKADHRTVATALEAYRLDNNQYPEQGTPNGTNTFPYSSDPNLVYGKDGNPAIAYHLSTPIAYVASTTSVFADPYFRTFGLASPVNDTRFYNYSGDYYYGRIYDSSQDGAVIAYKDRMAYLQERNHWHLRSRGPDTDYEKRSEGWEDYLVNHGIPSTGTQTPIASATGGISVLYDPTNGTASNGDIVRLGSDGVKN